MAGYAFARLRFPGREVLFILVLATLMIPDQLRLVPVYILLNNAGRPVNSGPTKYLVGDPRAGDPGDEHLPDAPVLPDDPARPRGGGQDRRRGFFTTFLRVMLPLATPALAAVAILQFQGTWNSFFWPLVLLQERTTGRCRSGWPSSAACSRRTGRR